MKEYDYVRLLVGKERYAKNGVHKDMTGWICDPRIIDDQHLVSFEDEYGGEIACIPIKEDDLEVFWEAPTKQVGVKVILYKDTYSRFGLNKGLRGVILAKGKTDGRWIVHFDIQEGLSQEIDFNINESDIAII